MLFRSNDDHGLGGGGGSGQGILLECGAERSAGAIGAGGFLGPVGPGVLRRKNALPGRGAVAGRRGRWIRGIVRECCLYSRRRGWSTRGLHPVRSIPLVIAIGALVGAIIGTLALRAYEKGLHGMTPHPRVRIIQPALSASGNDGNQIAELHQSCNSDRCRAGIDLVAVINVWPDHDIAVDRWRDVCSTNRAEYGHQDV